MTRDFKLLEHTLIPLALFVLNISSVHLLYQLFMGRFISVPSVLVAVCTVVMGAGVVKKNKFLMVPGVVLYLVVLVVSI